MKTPVPYRFASGAPRVALDAHSDDEKKEPPDRFWVLAVGDIFHPDDAPEDGPVTVTLEHLEQIVANAKLDRERHGARTIPIDLGHGTIEKPHDPDESRAYAYAGGFELDDDQLYAVDIEWSEKGEQMATEKWFKLTSPVIFFEWRDRVTGDEVGARIHSVAITNSPAQGNGLPMVAAHGRKYVLGAALATALQTALDAKLAEKTEGTTDIDPWTRDSIIRQMGEHSGLDDLTVERVLRGDLERPSMDEVLTGFARVLPISADELRSAAQQDAGDADDTGDPAVASHGAAMKTKKISLTFGKKDGEPETREVELPEEVADAIEATQLAATERAVKLEATVAELTKRIPAPDEVTLTQAKMAEFEATAKTAKLSASKLSDMEAEKRRDTAVREGRLTPAEAKSEPFFGASKTVKEWALILASRKPKAAWNPSKPKGDSGGDAPEDESVQESADKVVAALDVRKKEHMAAGMKELPALEKARKELLKAENLEAVQAAR